MSLTCACPSCGKSYRLKDSYAGKKVTCKCGKAFRVPAGVAEDGKPCPRCRAMAGQDDVICVQCGYDFRKGTGVVPSGPGAAVPALSGPDSGRDKFQQARLILAVVGAVVLLLIAVGTWRLWSVSKQMSEGPVRKEPSPEEVAEILRRRKEEEAQRNQRQKQLAREALERKLATVPVAVEGEDNLKKMAAEEMAKQALWQKHFAGATKNADGYAFAMTLTGSRKTYSSSGGHYDPGTVEVTVELESLAGETIFANKHSRALPTMIQVRDASSAQEAAFTVAECGAIKVLLAQAALKLVQPENAAGCLPEVVKLLELQKGRSTVVRRDAALTLGRMGKLSVPHVPALIEQLGDIHVEVSKAAAKALGDIGPATVAALAAVLKESPQGEGTKRQMSANRLERKKAHAMEALGFIGPAAARAVPALVEALSSNDFKVASAAAVALGGIGPGAGEDAATALAEKLIPGTNTGPFLQGLKGMGSSARPAAPALIAFLENTSKSAGAVVCAEILGDLQVKEAMPVLGKLFHTEVRYRTGVHRLTVLQQACYDALEKFGPVAAPHVLPAFASKYVLFPEKAEELLIGYGEAAIPALEQGIAEADKIEKRYRSRYVKKCKQAIAKIKGGAE